MTYSEKEETHMLQKDLFKIGKAIVIEGIKAVAFGAGINIARQSINLVSSKDAKTIKEVLSNLDTTLDTLIK